MLINLNKHAIVVAHNGVETSLAPCGTIATVKVAQSLCADVDGFPTVQNVFGAVEGLPAPADGVTYVVNAITLSALAGSRSDVVAPDTGPTALRDEKGQVRAVTRFVRG